MNRLSKAVIDSPLGPLTVVTGEGSVLGLFFHGHRRKPVIPGIASIEDVGLLPVQAGTDDAAVAMARTALERYFAGEDAGRWEVPAGIGTDFQRRIWAALGSVERGQVVSYGELAASIGRPSAVRAVGAAVGANPVSILVPCHRVLGAGATLTGYAGGLDRKRWLLEHEGVRVRA